MQENDLNVTTIEKKPIETVQKITQTPLKEDTNINSIVAPNYIRDKRNYRRFIKLIKANKVTTAIYTARILGMNEHTIASWFKTPTALKCLEDTSNTYINNIEQAKDWKAQAYLLDTLKGNKDKEQAKIDLNQLIVINTA